MLPDVIVYESMCGHTLAYAKELARLLNLPFMSVRQARKKLPPDTAILWMSWICEDQLVGYNRMLDFHIVLVVAVGIMPDSEEMKQRLIEENQLYCELFYLRGGMDKRKLSLYKRWCLRAIRKELEFKKSHQELTREQEGLLWSIQNNVDYTEMETLQPIVDFFSNDDFLLS